MKKGLFLFFITLNFSLFSQETKVDSVYNNLFSDVSNYRDFSEVHLGNIGLAKYNLLSPFKENNTNLKSLFPVNKKSKLFTDIFFVTGSGKENYLNVEHHQNLNKNLELDLLITKIASIGIYQTQESSISNYNLNLDYSPSNIKYNFNLKANYYRRYNELNGGIKDSIFNTLLDSNITLKSLFPVRFTSNSFSFNKSISKNQNYTYSHSYKLSNNPNDSIGYYKLNQSIGYSNQKFEFNSQNIKDFFDTAYIDTNITSDSLVGNNLNHSFSVSHIKNNRVIELGYLIEYLEYKTYSTFLSHVENTIFGSYKNTFGNYNYQSGAGIMFENKKFETYYLNQNLEYNNANFSIFQNYSANLNIYSVKYEFFNERYRSNHYEWDNNLDINHIVALNLEAKNENKKYKVGFNFESHSKSLLFDSNSNIIQSKISFISFNLNKELKLTKWLNWNANLSFQDILSKENVEMPNFVASNRVYFHGKILKNNILKVNVGFDVLYYTSFYSKAYNPALDKFVLQNNTKVGNYPFVDFFAEFYLKTNFAFFTTITHLNSDLSGNNYLATKYYPKQGRAFKFGMKWRLFE